MAIEIRIGAPHLTVHHGHAVLVSEPDGSVRHPGEKGLFFRDTRLVSSSRVLIEGQEWEFLSSANKTYFAATVALACPKLNTRHGDVARHALGLMLSRSLDGGMHEDLDLTNNGQSEAQVTLEVELGSDFADLFEVKAGRRYRRSGVTTEWLQAEQRLANRYRRADFLRGVVVTVVNSDSAAQYADGRIAFALALKPGGRWHACLLYDFIDAARTFSAPRECIGNIDRSPSCRELQQAAAEVARLRGPGSFDRIAQQATEDMVALRLSPLNRRDAEVPAGGVPWFLTGFGRDSIIAAWQYRLIDPELSRGALELLGSLQAGRRDDFRDAEPGKIMHELRHGELAHFGEIPHSPYYGSADATPLFLILLHSAWKCLGDDDLVRTHLKTAERCLDWIDQHGDRDGDGFQEYQRRSPAGYENQGWKDAGDAILYPDGTAVKGPKAVCELQGYVFQAWLCMAEVFEAFDHGQQAAALRDKARDLARRFDQAFWNDDEGFYALALDGDKKQVMTIGSNAGQCLWSGIVPRDRAARVIERLLQPDMWSGWGIRTLSSRHPAYNPFSYQNGSVWPHDNSIIAMGMKRYGFAAQAAQVAHGIYDAASYFTSLRLPELFAGIDRGELCFPVRYLGANVPQAWATGAIFAFVQMLIGFQPNAPAGRLELDPALPDWLPELNIHDLRLGDRRIDLRFWREGDQTRLAVTKGDLASVSVAPMSIPADILDQGAG